MLKINKVTTNYAKFGGVRTAEDVTALGFPAADMLGDDLKATNGNVSSIADKHFLQYTAPTNPGNSGGPLLNENGLVVGSGNHKELVENSKIYKNFYEKQIKKD